jgi:hypothetical protein
MSELYHRGLIGTMWGGEIGTKKRRNGDPISHSSQVHETVPDTIFTIFHAGNDRNKNNPVHIIYDMNWIVGRSSFISLPKQGIR